MVNQLSAMSNSGGIPGKGLLVVGSKPSGTDQTANLRDSISSLVGGNYTNLSDENAKANFARIAGIVGVKNAQNLFIHISQQNQRPGWSSMKPAERINNFYDIRSSDPATDETLQRVKAFGTGPQSGYSDSVSFTNQSQQGTPNNPNLAAIQTGGSVQQLKDYFHK